MWGRTRSGRAGASVPAVLAAAEQGGCGWQPPPPHVQGVCAHAGHVASVRVVPSQRAQLWVPAPAAGCRRRRSWGGASTAMQIAAPAPCPRSACPAAAPPPPPSGCALQATPAPPGAGRSPAALLTSVHISFTFSRIMLQCRSNALMRPSSLWLFLQLISTCARQEQRMGGRVRRCSRLQAASRRPGRPRWLPCL